MGISKLEGLFKNPLSAEVPTSEMLQKLEADGIILLRNFPTQESAYIAFLGRIGEPFTNYEAMIAGANPCDRASCINRVRVNTSSESTQFRFSSAGPLFPHTSRSWAKLRPKYFAMLMVDPGWQDSGPGMRGESVLLSWNEFLLNTMAEDATLREAVKTLRRTPITFAANNVTEDLACEPVVWFASDGSVFHVRLKSDMLEKLQAGTLAVNPLSRDYIDALEYFCIKTRDSRYWMTGGLKRGDLLILNNSLFAHGRLPFDSIRTTNGCQQVSSRELWSVGIK